LLQLLLCLLLRLMLHLLLGLFLLLRLLLLSRLLLLLLKRLLLLQRNYRSRRRSQVWQPRQCRMRGAVRKPAVNGGRRPPGVGPRRVQDRIRGEVAAQQVRERGLSRRFAEDGCEGVHKW
jgi:hypothetical protein